MKTIAIMASLDTKETEVSFVKQMIERLGCRALTIDVGVSGKSALIADVSREQVIQSGGRPWESLLDQPKHEKIAAMAEAASRLAPELYGRGLFDAILSIGGVAEHSLIGVAAMKALPIGVPKLMVSTVASGRRTFEPLVGSKDIVLDARRGRYRRHQRADPHSSGQCGCRRRRNGRSWRQASVCRGTS